MNAPTIQPCRGTFKKVKEDERLVLTQLIDFLPGVAPYESTTTVDFIQLSDRRVRMIVTLSQMHDVATTAMQKEGFTSQISKLERRYGAE